MERRLHPIRVVSTTRLPTVYLLALVPQDHLLLARARALHILFPTYIITIIIFIYYNFIVIPLITNLLVYRCFFNYLFLSLLGSYS